MNVKRIFGTLLTLGGICALIYAAMLFVNSSGGTQNMKVLGTTLVLGVIFFFAGIGLIRTTKDDPTPES